MEIQVTPEERILIEQFMAESRAYHAVVEFIKFYNSQQHERK